MTAPRILGWTHAGLFALSLAGAVVDISSLSVFGPVLAGGLDFAMVGLVLGMALVRGGRPGGRAMLLASDGCTMIVAIGFVALAVGQRPEPATPFAAVVAIAAAACFLVVLMTRFPPTAETVVRSRSHRTVLVALVALGVVSAATPALSSSAVSGSMVLSLIVGFVPPLLIGIAAWWRGSGWLLAVIGGSTFITLGNYAIALEPGSILTPSALLAVLSVVAGLRPPRSTSSVVAGAVSAGTVGAEAVVAEAVGVAPTNGRPTVAVVWALLGGVLFIPSVLLGRFPPVLIDCFDCPPPSPLAGPSIWVDFVVVVLVPLAAVVLAVAPTSRPVANGSAALVGLVGVALVLVQVAIGLARTQPFSYMPAAAPASVLLVLGFLASLVRPPWLAGTGRLAALASGLAALVWMFVGISGGFVDLPIAKVGGLVTGGIVALALAWEGGIGAGLTPQRDGTASQTA